MDKTSVVGVGMPPFTKPGPQVEGARFAPKHPLSRGDVRIATLDGKAP